MKSKALLLCATMLSVVWCGAAYAQTATNATTAIAAPAEGGGSGAGADAPSDKANTVGEVVVTAERRTVNLQKSNIAATVLNEKDILRDGVFTVDQLQFVSPSLTVNSFGQGNDVDIRGIGKGEHNTQTGTGVITYRDGAPTFPGYFQEEPYYDIGNIEVLRGPQGTFSGQNATGGAIEVTTANPVINGGNTGYLYARYGNFNDGQVQGAVNLPINDTMAARVSFNLQHRDTFYNLSGPWTGDPNLNWASFRFSLLWTPNPQTTVLWKTDADYLSNGGYFGDAQTNTETKHIYDVAMNWHTSAIDQGVRSILKVDYLDSAGIDFRSITSAQWARSGWTGDIDGTASNLPGENNWMIDEAVDTTLLTQEFNVISPSNERLTWVLGAYGQSLVYNFPFGQFDIGVPHGGVDEDLFGVNRTFSYAAFGQVGYKITDNLQLQVGLRYTNWATQNKATFLVPEYLAYGIDYYQDQTERGQNVTGKVALNWNIDPNNFAYAFVASGAKPGGLNTALYFYGGLVPPPFGQEYVTDYEIGWKSTMMDGHLRTQLGGYYNDFQHFQVITAIPNVPTQSTESNVPGHTKLYGLEASAQGVFGDFSFNMGLGLEHSELGTFWTENPTFGNDGNCNPTTGPTGPSLLCQNLKGHPQTYAPDFTFNVQAQFTFHLQGEDTLTPALMYAHISDQWATLFDVKANGDYLQARDLAGVTLAWKHDTWTTMLYCYNCTDDHYVAAVASPIRVAGAPRQFGISVMKTF
ncbi:MAG TPA: TonB-dependent receptor [Caulobacteraceae bacterium]|jgi:iron complex outermembrane receptor protein|nr:TonB-dependent receptor [Caulobacteraceae bacterium]